jgi:hypothetical protein
MNFNAEENDCFIFYPSLFDELTLRPYKDEKAKALVQEF